MAQTQTSPRRQSADARRNQLLDAAEALLLQRGLQGTTMSEVASLAGVAKGTTYLYFPSKTEVLAALRQRYVAGIETEVRQAVGRATTPSERIGGLVRGLLVAGTRRLDLHHVLFEEAGVPEPDAFAPVRAVFEEVIGEVVSGTSSSSGGSGGSGGRHGRPGRAGGASLALLTDFVLGGVHAALVRSAHASPAARRRVVTETVALVHRAVGVA